MNKSLILIIAGAVVIFVLGGGLGISYQAQKSGTSGSSNSDAVVKTLSSKVVPSIIAYGEVTNIQGKNITLSYGSDSIIIPVNDDSQIFSFGQSADTKTPPVQKKVTFAEIKKGDSLNVNLKLLSDGTIQGTSVVILPNIPAQTTPAPTTK